jgi:hypothetical protein
MATITYIHISGDAHVVDVPPGWTLMEHPHAKRF